MDVNYRRCHLFFSKLLSTVPFEKQIPYDQTRVRISVISYPFVGFFRVAFIWNNDRFFFGNISNLVLSLLFFTVPLFIHGGLHLDGWMDCSDAFFSYKDQEKKLEIMKDSRIGAFCSNKCHYATRLEVCLYL
ncbi:adenosylcobinamide-GDP ribazoletransferase [Anaerobacillus sp. HL2]|nr:adenosylcobinamide-GDP ribazoletransferase [Anaerobacillus sp. HL2]